MYNFDMCLDLTNCIYTKNYAKTMAVTLNSVGVFIQNIDINKLFNKFKGIQFKQKRAVIR